MKTIPVEQLNEQLTQALEQQDEHEAIALTKDADTIAWVVRVPKELRNAETDVVVFGEGANGRICIAQAKGIAGQPNAASPAPVFGAGRGTLTVVNDDDEHLKDFQEYMK